MTIYKPYTYLIGWSKLNVYYYGVRFSKGCSPDDLWKTYFTSSKHVSNFRKQNGEPDIISIRKIFDCADKARLWEHKVIRRLGAPKSSKWLNMSDNGNIFFYEGKRPPFTEEHRRKLSEANKKRKLSPEHKAKLIAGRKASKNSPEHIAATIASRLGSKASDETKKKMSKAKLDNPNTRVIASLAGKISAANRPPNYKELHSQRMKLWWADRKKKIGG